MLVVSHCGFNFYSCSNLCRTSVQMFSCHNLSSFVQCLFRSLIFLLFGYWILRILCIFCIHAHGNNFKVGVFSLIPGLFYSLICLFSLLLSISEGCSLSVVTFNCYDCYSALFSSLFLSFFIWFQLILKYISFIQQALSISCHSWPFLNLPANTSASSALICT